VQETPTKTTPVQMAALVELTDAELDKVAAGVSPFANPAGHKPLGQTPNPNPGE
jgi:hypothetical protein